MRFLILSPTRDFRISSFTGRALGRGRAAGCGCCSDDCLEGSDGLLWFEGLLFRRDCILGRGGGRQVGSTLEQLWRPSSTLL
jgi:hypothetical protein